MLIDKMINVFGVENCLILIGSSNTLNSRTPFSFRLRKKMLNTLYPKLKVLPVPDSTPNLSHYSEKGNRIWFKTVKKIERRLGAKFIFFGGSKKDLGVLSQRYKTRVLLSRKLAGKDISATKVRKALITGDGKTISKLVDTRVTKLILGRRLIDWPADFYTPILRSYPKI